MNRRRDSAVSLLTFLLLASMWGCGATQSREGTGEYVDDSVITTKVKTAIFNDSTLKVNEINVETFTRSRAVPERSTAPGAGGCGPAERLRQVSGGHRPGGQSRTRGCGREVRQERHADQVTAGGAVLELLTTHTTGACWAAAQTASCARHHASGRDR
jgi:hypothetical protein